MKGILIGVTALLAICSAADAQSIGYLMKRADLVVSGQAVEDAGTRRFQMFRLEDIELIKGDLRDAGFRVARFKDVGCQVPLFPGERVLVFLRRLSGDIDGLDGTDPAFVILAGEQGKLRLVDGQEEVILEAARRHAALEALDAQERSAAMAGIFRTALAVNNEALLYSALFDMVATPGAMARLTMEDGVKALERFLEEPPETRLKRRLLHFNGEILPPPPGLTEALEPLVRTRGGCFYRDALAAILARTNDPATPRRLIAGFAALGRVEQENVIHVLGRLGRGKGVSALQALAAENLDTLHVLIIEALKADRTEHAVAALAEMAVTGHHKAADAALYALIRINTPAARLHLKALSESSEVGKRINQRAKELLGLLK